jgi:hypothetical protein
MNPEIPDYQTDPSSEHSTTDEYFSESSESSQNSRSADQLNLSLSNLEPILQKSKRAFTSTIDKLMKMAQGNRYLFGAVLPFRKRSLNFILY